MKFGHLLEQAMRQDWAANYVNYKRAKDQIKAKADVPTYKEFIENECAKVERFYNQKMAEVEKQSAQLTQMMSDKKTSHSSVSALVKVSWTHTEDLRGLYDFCKLCSEGIRKSLKKYDKVLKKELQKGYFENLKTNYAFFRYRDNLTDLLQTCAVFWNDGVAGEGQTISSADIRDSLPATFPLASQMEDQEKRAESGSQGETETEAEDEEVVEDEEEKAYKKSKKKKSEKSEIAMSEISQEEVEADVDMEFQRNFTKQRMSKPQWRSQLADYKTLSSLLKELAAVAGNSNAFVSITSLSMAEHPDQAYGASPEIVVDGKPFKEVDWFKLFDREIDIVTKQTNREITRERNDLSRLRDACEQWSAEMKDTTAEQTGVRARNMLTRLSDLEAKARQCGHDFLDLEKFVNLNYQAFEKLLKSHDRLMPATPCHQFYMAKLRNQEWIRNDFSDIFVALSDCHSLL
mmetsp:Transcript_20680/g.40172  ORF Transcript_20680/g.40172 Transcript_20680/m.40172 type:complete len:461 (-) Transcript_20680:1458-2840(-)